MKIGLVAPVKPSHPYLENDPAPLFALHYLRISPWLWFRLKEFQDGLVLSNVLERTSKADYHRKSG